MASIVRPTFGYSPLSYGFSRKPLRYSLRSAKPPISMQAEGGDASSRPLWALDFDGVICDSCGESSLSAWKAANILWPGRLQTPEAIHQDTVLEKMRAVRPVVETGYENIIQIRLLLEGTSTEAMLSDWPTLLQQSMKNWQLNRTELVDLFGSTRDRWMMEDLKGWLAPNRMFDGIPEAMEHLMKTSEVYIVTTKQARFTYALLKDMAGIHFPEERIISTTVSGQPKTESLHELQERHPNSEGHFIEDKLSTLHKVCQDDGLIQWSLYLADWGYNTQAERDSVKDDPHIRLISLSECISMMTELSLM